MDLSGAAVIVTGGSSGLGAATARRLARDGALVVVADVDESNGEALAIEIGGTFVRTDVTDSQEVQTAVDVAVGMGTLRGLVNCAGILARGRTIGPDDQPHDLDLFKSVIETNLVGTFNAIRLSAAAMAKADPLDADGSRGAIVNTASSIAFNGLRGKAAYAASKAGVVGLTIPIARDLASLGIRVNTIAPGPFDTQILSESGRRILGALVLFPRRLGRVDEFADLAHMLLTHGYMNGATITLDGGGDSDVPPPISLRLGNKVRSTVSRRPRTKRPRQ